MEIIVLVAFINSFIFKIRLLITRIFNKSLKPNLVNILSLKIANSFENINYFKTKLDKFEMYKSQVTYD